MEAAVLYTLGAIHGIETLCLAAVSDIIGPQGAERISDDELRAGVDRMVRIACELATG